MNRPAESVPVRTGGAAPPEKRAREWWCALTSQASGDRAACAQLRRCRTPLDAVRVPAAIALARRLGRVPEPGAAEWKQKGFERALSLAVILAHVRSDSSTSLLRTLGWARFPYDEKESDIADGRPILSELRFRRLLQMEGEAELITGVVRLVALAGGATDVADLARVVLRWNEDRTKRDLALTYFHADARGLDSRD